ncbi:MAG: type II toxin-antitoxin system RelE/ParE family toxin [Pseudomonadota bacterium]
MSYRLRLAPGAADDLQRLFDFLADQYLAAAERARQAVEKAFELLRNFPFACRKASASQPSLRELVIEFGHAGYVALFEIQRHDTITVLAVRHQREDDFY